MMAASWQKITAWACLLLASVVVHVALGEVVLTPLLIVFMTVAFTGRKGPQQTNGSDAEDIDIEVQHPDEDEPTTANPLNAAQNDASEEAPKLRPLRHHDLAASGVPRRLVGAVQDRSPAGSGGRAELELFPDERSIGR